MATTGKTARVNLRINGSEHSHDVEPRYLLADYLRHAAGLKGTHIGCEHGACGACTVLIDGKSARSCLHFAAGMEGCEITTVEGITKSETHTPLTEAFHESHALQCGYCTPGMLITATELLESNPEPSEQEVREALTNNICRCTGYSNIVKAVLLAAEKMRAKAS